jgi:NAD(P)-dependent dehydrogenase (short-subunit alcohol dehydrogenase family)
VCGFHTLAGDAVVQEKVGGKVIVVTGASGALGRVVAETALARGGRVAAIDFAAAQGAPAGARLDLGGVDLTDAAQARQAIDSAAAHFGKIDALINIAGGFAFETVAGGDPKTWQRMQALNLTTALNASRAAIPHLLASSAARIVNIGAFGALQAGAGMGAYAASKAGVHRLTEALAAEHKGRITVNAVLPSIIDTAANRESMPKSDFSKWVMPQELADVILFLVSDAASAVTGALLPVTGRV